MLIVIGYHSQQISLSINKVLDCFTQFPLPVLHSEVEMLNFPSLFSDHFAAK